MDSCSPWFAGVSLEGRNSRCFEDNVRSMPDLKLFFFRSLLDWLSTLQNQFLSSILDLPNYVIFVLDLFTPYTHPECLGVSFFYINKSYYL